MNLLDGISLSLFLGQQAGCSPDTDQQTNSEEPVRPHSAKLPCLTLGSLPTLVLDDRKAVAEHHCCTEREGHLLDEKVEIDELFHWPDASDSSGKSVVRYAQRR